VGLNTIFKREFFVMKKLSVFFVIGLMLSGALFLAGCQMENVSDQVSGLQVLYSTEREVIGSQPGRPFSSAVKIGRTRTQGGVTEIVGETLYVSGQVGVNPETGDMVSGDIAAETRQVLTNLKSVAETAGFSLSNAVRCTVYLVDMDDYAAMNEAYLEFFPDSPPSRACVGVKDLVRDFRVEISLVAEK
jgi:2-iminobutanoate/2-iminopropanoate deaminase